MTEQPRDQRHVRLFPIAPAPYLQDALGVGLRFVLEGDPGVNPERVAEELHQMQRLTYVRPTEHPGTLPDLTDTLRQGYFQSLRLRGVDLRGFRDAIAAEPGLYAALR